MSEIRRKLMIQKEDETPQYIQDGLIFLLDGINKGSIPGAWTDLINGYSFAGTATELDNGWEFSGSQYMRNTQGLQGISQLNTNRSWTVEVALHFKSPSIWGCILTTNWDYSSRQKNLSVSYGVYDNNAGFLFGSSYSDDNRKMESFLINKNSDCTASFQHRATSVLMNMQTVSAVYKGSTLAANAGVLQVGSRTVSWADNGYANAIFYAIRVYNRKLTQQEMLFNQQLDIQRFNLNV